MQRYFLAAKAFNALPAEVRSIKYNTVFRKALEEHCNRQKKNRDIFS